MTAYQSWEGFNIAKVCDFSTDMSVELIQKSLVPQVDKNKLISYVRNDMPEGYLGFLRSPLMVTVLILTATEVNRVSDNLLSFLEDAFEALWWRHDIKKSGYARVVLSKLSKSEFKKFFSAFCATSYFAEAIEMNEVQLHKFVSKAKSRLPIDASEEDLIYDMRINVCLLLQDGGHYLFGHRLFQEYFCAGFVSSLSGGQYIRAIEMAEKRSATDEVLRFVLQMDQEKAERDFVLPILQVLMKDYKVDRCSMAAYQRALLGEPAGWRGRREPDQRVRIHLNAVRSMYKLEPSVNDIRELEERSKHKEARYSLELIEARLGDDRRNMIELHDLVSERVKRHSDIDSLFG